MSAQTNTLHLHAILQMFLFHCRYEKNLSDKTLKAYETDIRQFCDFVAPLLPELQLQHITPGILKEYIRHLSHYQPKTVKRKLASLKAMFNFMEIEDENYIHPFHRLKIKIKTPFLLPAVMNMDEVSAILSHLYRQKKNSTHHTNDQYLTILRNIAVIELLFGTGIRVSELCSLQEQTVDLDNGHIKVYGKGSKERIIHIGRKEILQALIEYKRHRIAHSPSRQTFFFENRLKTPLSPQSVRLMIQKIASQTRITKHITPHTFRHTFATLLLEEGIDIKYIQSILGHSSLATTQIYTHVNTAKQKTILCTHHPRRKLVITYISN